MIVYLQGSPKAAGVPVAVGALLYHSITTVLFCWRSLTGQVNAGPLVPENLGLGTFEEQWSRMCFVAIVLHGGMSFGFLKYLVSSDSKKLKKK